MGRRTKREMTAAAAADRGAPLADVKRLDHNTIQYAAGDRVYIRLHETDIAIFDKKKKFWILNTGGWKTPTTKDRLNKFSPARISQSKNRWRISYAGRDYPFSDGMKVDADGRPLNIRELERAGARERALLKSIDGYVAAVRRHIKENGKPEPAAGDCFYCYMSEVKTGRGAGDVLKSADHLRQHIKEKYIFGSIMFRAIQARGYGSAAAVWAMADGAQIARDLRRYLKTAFGLCR